MLALLTAIFTLVGILTTVAVAADAALRLRKAEAGTRTNTEDGVANAIRKVLETTSDQSVWRLIRGAFDLLFDRGHRGRPEFIRAGLVSCGILGLMTARWRWVYPDRSQPVLDPLFDPPLMGTLGVTLIVLIVILGDYIDGYPRSGRPPRRSFSFASMRCRRRDTSRSARV